MRSSIDPEALPRARAEIRLGRVHAGVREQPRAVPGSSRRQFRLAQPKLILASRLVRESALVSASSSSILPSRTRL